MWMEERTYTMEEIERETGLDRRTIAYYVQQGLLPKVGRRGPRTRYPRQFVDRLLFIQKIRGLQDRGELGNYTLDDIREIFEAVPERMIADIVAGREPLEIAPSGGTWWRRPADGLGSPRDRLERMRRLSEQRRSSAEEAAPSAEPRPSRSGKADRPALNEPPRGKLLLQRWDPSEVRHDMPAAGGPPPKAAVEPPAPAAPARDDSRIFIDLDEAQGELELRRVSDEDDAVATTALHFLRQAPLPEPPHPLVRLLARLDRAASQAPKGAISQTWTRAEVTPDIVLTVRGLDQDSSQLLERIARILRHLIESGRGESRK
jgi:DNA-binding transcriptional MerR regulator